MRYLNAASTSPFNWWDSYHVLNRRVGRSELFEKPNDYSAFEKILAEAYRRTGIRIAAYCLMPNHWYLLLWPCTEGATRHAMTGAHEKVWRCRTNTRSSF